MWLQLGICPKTVILRPQPKNPVGELFEIGSSFASLRMTIPDVGVIGQALRGLRRLIGLFTI
jgi:hypothetical protein